MTERHSPPHLLAAIVKGLLLQDKFIEKFAADLWISVSVILLIARAGRINLGPGPSLFTTTAVVLIYLL